MENTNPNRNRNIWIIVIAVIAALLLVCLLIGAAVAVFTGILGFTAIRDRAMMGPARVTEQTEQVFDVEPGAALAVNNFAGNIRVRSGPTGQITLIVTRRVGVPADLARVEVDIRDEWEGLQIRTSQPTTRPGNWSVEFDITVPPDTVLDLDTGAGNLVIEGVEGEIVGRTGAGNVTVRDSTASVTVRSGAGNISYEGEPSGLCVFDTGAGNITLSLPAGAEVELDLDSGVGNVELGGFEVEGEISRSRVRGVIGSGEQATIEADAGVGNVVLVQR